MNSKNFYFIVGKANSGTTLLMSLLNAHPSIQATPEVDFFVFFYQSWKNKTSFSNSDYGKIKLYLKKFNKRKKSNAFSWDEDVFRTLIGKADYISFKVIYECFYKAFKYADGEKECSHYFDKNPYNTMLLNDIVTVFPDAKFVYVVRDPRANYLSRKEKLKAKKSNIYFDTQLWKIFNNSALSVLRKYQDRFFVLRYEDLVSHPVVYLKKSADFFGFQYDDRMLSFFSDVKENNIKKIEDNIDGIRAQAKEKYLKLSRPINTDRVEAWREKLSEDEISIIGNICSGDYFGYEIKNKKSKINVVKYYKGLLLAKALVLKNKIVYHLPLSVKLKLIKEI